MPFTRGADGRMHYVSAQGAPGTAAPSGGGRAGGPGNGSGLQALLDRARTEESKPDAHESSWRDWAAMGVRGVSGLGSIASAEPGVGTAIGAGTGALGEWLAQQIEGRPETNWKQVGVQGAIGAVPFGRAASTAAVVGKGALHGGVSAGMTESAETGALPSAGTVAKGAAIGAGGGLLSDLVRKFIKRPPTVESGIPKPEAYSPNTSGYKPGASTDAVAEPFSTGIDPHMPNTSGYRPGDFGEPAHPFSPAEDLFDRHMPNTSGYKPGAVGEPALPLTSGAEVVDRYAPNLSAPRVAGAVEDLSTSPAHVPPDSPLRELLTQPRQNTTITPSEWGDWGGAEQSLPTLGLNEAGSHVAIPKPRYNASEVAGALRGRQKFASKTGLAPQPNDELDRMGIEYGRTQSELKRLLGMSDADPREVARMEQGARELGSRLRGKARESMPQRSVSEPGSTSNDAGRFVPPKPRLQAAKMRPEDRSLLKQTLQQGQPAPAPEPYDSVQNEFSMPLTPGGTMPNWGPESGAASTELLQSMGTGVIGAGIGAYEDDDDRMRGTLAGAAIGAGLPIAARSPLLERLRFASMLSSPLTHLKNAGSVLGSTVSGGIEKSFEAGNLGPMKRTLKELLNVGDTVKAGRDAFSNPHATSKVSGGPGIPTEGVMSWPGRALGAEDAAGRSILERTGDFTADEAERLMGAGNPQSKTGQAWLQAQRATPLTRFVMPFAKTAINYAEQGIERSVGAGRNLVDAATSPAGKRLAAGQLGLSGLAGLLGSQWGQSEFAKEHPKLAPFLSAAAGPYALPFAMGHGAGVALGADKDPITGAATGLTQQIPLASEYALDPARALSSFVPNAARDVTDLMTDEGVQRDTGSAGILGPMLAKIPFLADTLPEKPAKHRKSIQW